MWSAASLSCAINFDFIMPPQAILTLAFKAGRGCGGLVGGGIRLAMQYGVARGLFSNESGMGSAPLVASAAQTRNPVRQALVSSTGTFWDTVVVCLMTGLVLVSNDEKPGGQCGKYRKRRSDDHRRIRTDSVYRSADLDDQHHYVRVLHHPRMVVLRRALLPSTCSAKGDSAV